MGRWQKIGLTLATLVVGGVASLSSCSGEPTVTAPDEPAPVPQQWSVDGIEERHILLSDGREVLCLTWVDSGYQSENTAAGMSCDWEHTEGHE